MYQSFDDVHWSGVGVGDAPTLFAVTCANGSSGWVAGTSGFIARTDDAGKTFTVQHSGTTNDLFGIRFASLDDGVAAGANGTLLVTHDGGATWSAVAIAASTLRAVAVSATTTIVVGDGGLVLRSSDHGATWTQATLDASAALRGVAMSADAGDILIVDDHAHVWSSRDQGATFAVQTTATQPLFAVAIAADSATAIAVGAHGLALTRGAGDVWRPSTLPVTTELRAALVAEDGARIFAAGDEGALYKSDASGGAWASIDLATRTAIYGLDDF
jgi:photosystem II stability/assembly factor-like uncharacterized protein